MTTPQIFDRRLHATHRTRAAGGFADVAFLKERMVQDIAERLAFTNRSFRRALDLGCHTGQGGRMLAERGTESVISCDLSPAMAALAEGPRLAASEEWLPFADHSFDLIISAGTLHWVNDLPGCLAQIYRCLTPDGLFLASFPGGESLRELRFALLEGEAEILGGARPHISPMVDLQSAAGLLQRIGFALPVADTQTLTLSYPSLPAMLTELRRMGETSALAAQPPYLRKDILIRAAQGYQERHGAENGRLPLTVELLGLTGWKPHPSQPKAAPRGSGKVSLTHVFPQK